MPQYPVKVRLDFGEGWNSLNNDQRSLINFFMKDAALYIVKTTDNGQDHYYGSIQSTVRCFFDHSNDNNLPFNLVIPYTSSNIELGDLFTSSGLPINEYLYLTSTSSYLTYCYKSYHNNGVDLASRVINVPITINTIVNNQENVDSSLLPSFINDILTVPLANTSALDYRFQLRSSNFGISTVGGITHKVYYKIGVCQIRNFNTDVVQDIKTVFVDGSYNSGKTLHIGVCGICSIGRTTLGALSPDNDMNGGYPTFSFNDAGLQSLSDNYYEIDLVPNRAIFPLYLNESSFDYRDDSSYNEEVEVPDAVLFIELYNAETGLPANLNLHEDPIASLQVSSSLDGEYSDIIVAEDCGHYYYNRINLTITDSHVNDNAFIETLITYTGNY